MEPNQGMLPDEPAHSAPPPPPTPEDALDPEAEAERVAAIEAEAEARRAVERLRLHEALLTAEAVGGRAHQGLMQWTVIVFLGSLAGFLTGRPEAPMFLAASGLFALTQSWDVRDRARTGHPAIDVPLVPGEMGRALRIAIPMLAPIVGAFFYLGLGVYARGIESSPPHVVAANWCVGAAVLCAIMALPPISRGVAARLMGGAQSHTAQLAAAIAVFALLLPLPVRLMFDDFLGALPTDGRPLVDPTGLIVQLACEVLFAAATVGLLVVRDFRAVCVRLGLSRMGGREWLIAAIGLAAVIGLNTSMEWLEREHFHALWLADQDMVRRLVGSISLSGAIVLGLSAGAGEEILVRGALQPRAGVFWASMLFAAGHVQYTWFGMLTILLLGIVLGLVRRMSNTTTAIAVHMLYDVVAALGSTQAH